MIQILGHPKRRRHCKTSGCSPRVLTERESQDIKFFFIKSRTFRPIVHTINIYVTKIM